MERRNSRFSHLFIKSPGFTLIELLIGISIFLIIITAIYTTLMQGITTFRKSEEKVTLYQELRLAGQELSTDIRNTIKLGVEKFEGSPTSLTFVTVDGQTLSKVTYQWDKNKLLKRKRELIWQGGKELEEIMLDNVTKVEFKYLEDQWYESWNTTNPPKAVKVTLEVDKKIFTTIVFIPTRS